jgi:thiosulfate dehydrogenase
MLLPILVLLIAIVVLLWWRALDKGMHALAEQRGLPYDEKRARSKRWAVYGIAGMAVAVAFFTQRETDVKEVVPEVAVAPPSLPPAVEGPPDSLWAAPDTSVFARLDPQLAARIRYGRSLIANTAFYLGPHGILDQRTNGMNCQNCHLDAGTKPWGNNYGSVMSTYPKFRERSGTKETVFKRVNECIERSLNGRALDSTSNEMQAILAYIAWVGADVPKGATAKGSGIVQLAYLDRPADPAKGGEVFVVKCTRCHGPDGAGKLNADGRTYQYPPLWGPHSYNIGAGLYRLTRFAGYVKANMPQGATWDKPQLTDEEAWDVAAYINSQQRPERDLSKDYPRLAGKPVDNPFGPYADNFNEQQHKYGPFGPIAAAAKKP